MRNLLLLSLIFVAACSAGAPVTLEDLAPVVFEEGMTLAVPCDFHGFHNNTLISSKVVRLYEFTDDQGGVNMATAEEIQEILDILALAPIVRLLPPEYETE